MATLTNEQVKGTRFEIYLEHLLSHFDYYNILRNVEFRKKEDKHSKRQADLVFNVLHKNKLYKVLLEAKYSTNNEIKYNLRCGVKSKRGARTSIDNLIDEVIERKRFIKYDFIWLATNSTFDNTIQKEACKNNIVLIDQYKIESLNKKAFGSKNYDSNINNIDVHQYNLSKNIIYV